MPETPTERAIAAVLAELLTLMNADGASVWLLGADHLYRAGAARGVGASRLRGAVLKSAPILHRNFGNGRPFLIEDVRSERSRGISARGRATLKRTGVRAFASVPIPRGRKWEGLLAVSFLAPRRFTPTEVGYLRLVAKQIGATLESTRLLAESRARERAMSAFAEVSALVSGSLDLATVLRRIADNAARILDASHAFVYLAEPDGTLVGAAATRKWNRQFVGTRVKPSETTAARWAFRHRRTQVVEDARNDPRISPRLRRIFGTRAIVTTPLMRERTPVGVLAILDTRTPRGFSRDDIERVETLASYAAVAIGHAAIHSALREREAELRILSERLANAHESERRRIARELHDVVGQGLAALALELAAAERAAKTSESLPLAPARRLLRETADAARRLSAELHPGILDDLGLLPAVRWYCGEIARRSGLAVTFHESPTLVISADAAVVLYRAVQEGLANVVRHAQAKSVSVRILSHARGVSLEVEDDGVGIKSPSTRRQRPGVGLLAIRERAAALGGWAELGAVPKRGAILRVNLPRTLRRS